MNYKTDQMLKMFNEVFMSIKKTWTKGHKLSYLEYQYQRIEYHPRREKTRKWQKYPH